MRKITIFFCGILGFLFIKSYGQEIHSSAEIFQIMEKSPVSYELQELEKEVLPPDRSENLNYNHYYRVVNDNGITTYQYSISDEVKEFSDKAEEYFNNENFPEARVMYLKALEIDSSYYQVMTYIGQTYGIEGDFKKAIEWYKKTIRLNFIDYMAHWFLADAYLRMNMIDEAVDEITLAKILNRNNQRINKSYENIYEKGKLKTTDWIFNPQIEIDSISTNKVRIAFNPDWLGYAMVKAVWLYEPNYKESMGVADGSISTLEISVHYHGFSMCG